MKDLHHNNNTILFVAYAIAIPLLAATPSRDVQTPFPVVTVRTGKPRMVQRISSDLVSGIHLFPGSTTQPRLNDTRRRTP